MPSGGFSTGWLHARLVELAAGELWLGAVTDDPRGLSDPFSVEVIGGSYEREDFTPLVSGTALIVHSTVTFLGIPGSTHLAGVILTDNDVGGTFLACALMSLSDQFTMSAGGAWVIDADDLVFGIDLGAP